MKIHQDILDSCITVAQQAGAFQMQYFRSMPESSNGSGGMGDMKTVRETVSFVDVECEKILSAGLLPLVEGAGFYGEEGGKSGSQELVWIVDPLDGTTNYLSGLDQFSVSIALVKDGQPLLGVIYKPSTGEVYSSLKGQGAYYNGIRTKPAYPEVTEIDALFVTGFPYRSPDVSDQFFDAAAQVLTLGRGIRRSGSAALDVANLSMGWLQGFWETDLQPYDIAAGLLLMEENGIVVSNQHGDAFNMFEDRLIVAALPKVHPALLETIASSYEIFSPLRSRS